MFPSSSRVKLNRASFRDVHRLEAAAPRRRRRTRPQQRLGDQQPFQTEKLEETGTSYSKNRKPVVASAQQLKSGTRDVGMNPAGCVDSEGDLREVVRTSHCNPCGEGTSPFLHRPTVRKQALKSCSSKLEPPAVECKKQKKSAVTDTSKKLANWTSHYPKVTLCDIAKICHQCIHKCGYVLPDVLKTKEVTCFKRNMKTGFWLRPSCFRHNKQKRDKKVKVKNSKRSPAIQNGRSFTEHQKYPDYSDSRGLSNPSTSNFHKNWKGDDSAASLPLLPGNKINGGERRAGMWKIHAEDLFGSVCDPIGAEFRKEKRMKLSKGLGHGNYFGSDVEKPLGWKGDLAKTYGTQTSSEEETEVLKDKPESFSCQRVRVYLRKRQKNSCARVYMPWSFVKSEPALGALNSLSNLSAGLDDPSARNISVSETANHNKPGSHSNQIKDMLQIKETPEEDGDRNAKMISHQYRKGMLRAPVSELVEKSGATFPSDTALFSTPAWRCCEPDTDAVSGSSLPVNRPETDCSRSTTELSEISLIDWKMAFTLSSMSPPTAKGSPSSYSVTSLPFLSSQHSRVKGVCSQAVDKALFHSEETQITSFNPQCSATTSSSDSNDSSDSSLLLQQESGKDLCAEGNAPKCLFCNDTRTIRDNRAACAEESSFLCSVPNEHCVKFDSTDWILPPLLSPIISPKRYSFKRNSGHDDEDDDDEEIISINQSKMIHACHIPLIANAYNEDSTDYVKTGIEEVDGLFDFKTLTDSTTGKPESCPSSDEDVDSTPEGERKVETHCEDDVEQDNRSSEQETLNLPLKASLTSGDTDSQSSPSIDNDAAFSDEELTHSTDKMESNSSITGSEENNIQVEAPVDSQSSVLDEFAAFEQDILLIDVIQDDPELFNNLPAQTKLKRSPTRVDEAPKNNANTGVMIRSSTVKRASVTFGQKSSTVTGFFDCSNANMKDESSSRPWRPQCRPTLSEAQHIKCPAPDKHLKYMAQPDVNNNRINGDRERSQTVRSQIPTRQSSGTALWHTNSMNVTDYWGQKSNPYCRHFFSESPSCPYNICRFPHVPLEGDEKFCIESVTKFTQNPVCLHKAGAVYVEYYKNNPKGVFFSMAVLLALLWALLKAGMVIDVFSVLSVSLAQSIVPTHEFLLALFNFVKGQGLVGFTPELIRLTFQMAKAGLELSLDCLDSVKNTPMFQQMVHSNSPLSVSGNHMPLPSPEHLTLAQAILETELCIKQEEWRRMGDVFRSICQSNQHPLQLERVSGRIAIALLTESKDRLSLPFVTFAETVCRNESVDSPCRNFIGRIGVSLMLRYHKTHHWVKGRRVVEMLTSSKISYSLLKSLFGNEDKVSRCCLITVATEFFLLSGSVEGALRTLRENQWFLSSCSWPCEPADLESRTGVLVRLSEKTSLRDKLEVLCKLPGIKEPSDYMDMSHHNQLFSSHLQVCVDRHILPVAVDTVEFMLSKKLAVDQTVLQTLLHKLGKQNLWLRAREVFRHSLRAGYYPGVSAPPGFRTLIVPSGLEEVELALACEMFITVNTNALSNPAETSGLSVMLKRTQSSESDFLSAASCLLDAACILQPKLTIRYNAVNSSQEQIFTLDTLSAQRWLRHNRLWAADFWTH